MRFVAGLVTGILATVLVAVGAWFGVAYSGAYDVSVADRHADAVRWMLETTMHRSVARRAGGAALPEEPGEALLAEGGRHYAETCALCHGRPGGEAAPWSRAMRPEPPHLAEAASEWTAQEIHWIVENGLRMTGMPAFGQHLSREELVAITAFVDALPALTARDYGRLTGGAGADEGADQGAEGGAHAHGGDARSFRIEIRPR